MEKTFPTFTVLYFEDEPGNFDTLASMKYGLDVQYATSGEEGLMLFERDPLKWDAIILDANMPYESGTKASIDSLLRIEKKIADLSGNSIPYFVYSAHGELLEKILPKEDWQSQAVYNKSDPSSFDALCSNIRIAVADNRTIEAIVKRKYPLIRAVAQLECNPPSESELVSIIKVLELTRTPDYDPDRDETIYNRIRVVLEWVFRYLYEVGILQGEEPTTTNISACSRSLGQNRDVPILIQRSTHSLVTNCNEGSHGTAIRSDTKDGVCPYAVKSTVYDLLNVLHWIVNL